MPNAMIAHKVLWKHIATYRRKSAVGGVDVQAKWKVVCTPGHSAVQKWKDLSEAGMPKDESDLFTNVEEAAREYAQSLTATDQSVQWEVLDFTRRIYGHPDR